ncbi:Ubiquitin-fold modifier-conjugating enzyme 1, partial [Glycine soja]
KQREMEGWDPNTKSTLTQIPLLTTKAGPRDMYRGGKICLTVHFKPLWAKNCPRFGIAHALCLGLAPWLAAEVPILVDSGMIKHKDDTATTSTES